METGRSDSQHSTHGGFLFLIFLNGYVTFTVVLMCHHFSLSLLLCPYIPLSVLLLPLTPLHFSYTSMSIRPSVHSSVHSSIHHFFRLFSHWPSLNIMTLLLFPSIHPLYDIPKPIWGNSPLCIISTEDNILSWPPVHLPIT